MNREKYLQEHRHLAIYMNGKSVRDVRGRLIGSGVYRKVYQMADFKDYVLKVEVKPKRLMFANVCEWSNYQNNSDWEALAPWLAPCMFIDETGLMLIQQKVDQVRPVTEFPKKIPSLFTDLKSKNFGWIGDRFVCCDYSFLVHTDFKMVKPKWRIE